MGQAVGFFEVVSPDHERAQKFYAELFDWTIDADPAMGGFGLVNTRAGDGAIPGGIGPEETPGDAGVRIYVRVDDLEAYLGRVEQHGGKRLSEPVELPDGYGRIAMFADPDGNRVGLWS
jgi:predicted enzyme related to lactoylglutathione lyase